MHQPTSRSTVGSHLVRYISRSSVRLSRVRRYSLSVDSQSMVGGYFPNGSPTFSRFNGRYLCGLSFDMAVDISTDSRGTMKYFSKSRRVCCGMHTFSAKTFCIKNLRARQVFRLSDFSKKTGYMLFVAMLHLKSIGWKNIRSRNVDTYSFEIAQAFVKKYQARARRCLSWLVVFVLSGISQPWPLWIPILVKILFVALCLHLETKLS